MPDNFGFWGDLARWAGNQFLPGEPFSGGGGGAVAPDMPVAQPVFGRDTDGTYDWNPLPDSDDLPAAVAPSSAGGCNLQVMVAPMQKTINKAPRGYVIVNHPQTNQKVAMLKSVARSCGLWKPRAKPLFTASDAKTIRKAARLQKKGDRLAKMLNGSCSSAPLRRSRGKR